MRPALFIAEAMPPSFVPVIAEGDISGVKDNVKEHFERIQEEFSWKLNEESLWTTVSLRPRHPLSLGVCSRMLHRL